MRAVAIVADKVRVNVGPETLTAVTDGVVPESLTEKRKSFGKGDAVSVSE